MVGSWFLRRYQLLVQRRFNEWSVLEAGLLAIFTSGDSSQHSLLTWVTWVGANATMAAWLYEHNGRHLNRAIAVNVCNSLMCLATSILIVTYRV